MNLKSQWDTPFEPDAGNAAVGNAAFTAPYDLLIDLLIFQKAGQDRRYLKIISIHAAFSGAHSERDW